MKIIYKDCEIEAYKSKTLTGETELFFSVFDDGFEVTSGFSCGSDSVRDYVESLKDVVDDYKLNPQDY